jgi:ABC-type branched-subunit amino acid transport system permease subunit
VGLYYTSAVEASAFEIDRFVPILFVIIIGSLGSILSSFLGAAFIVLLPIFLDKAPCIAGFEVPVNLVTNLQSMIFGALIVFFLIVEPKGSGAARRSSGSGRSRVDVSNGRGLEDPRLAPQGRRR